MKTVYGSSLLLVLLIAASGATVQADDADVAQKKIAKMKSGLPREAAKVIDRIIDCGSLAGEAGDDKAENDRIGRQEAKLNCEGLDHDEQLLLKKYPNKKKQLEKAFKAATEFQ